MAASNPLLLEQHTPKAAVHKLAPVTPGLLRAGQPGKEQLRHQRECSQPPTAGAATAAPAAAVAAVIKAAYLPATLQLRSRATG
eukprot:61075-Pelagomonas_calceolata.AAC.1